MLRPSRLLMSLACAALVAATTLPAFGADEDAFQPTGSLEAEHGRANHGAVRLLDGRVLVVGGYGATDGGALATAEVHDPATGTWAPAGALATPRTLATTTLLADGRVLVAGGSHHASAHASAEVWDPATGTFSATGSMSVARFAHAATRLADGRVLVTGGNASTGSPVATASAELYDPTTGTWSTTGALLHARQTHTSTLLADGRVLVAGGDPGAPGFVGTTTCQVWNPATGTFSAAASCTTPRAQHAAARLLDGRVLLAGGNPNATGTLIVAAEVYDPASDTWSSAGSTTSGSTFPMLVALSDGRALCAGGLMPGGTPTALADVFDPATGAFAPTASMGHARQAGTATLLEDGSVLVVGGYASFSSFPYWNTACERFVPSTPDAPPTAHAGPDQAVHAGDVVTLDGSGSHDDATPSASLDYAWTLTVRPSTSTAALSSAGTATPTFTADVVGTYVITLVVTDEAGQASPADEVVVSSQNLPPTVDAGPDVGAEVDAEVVLAGSAYDPDGDAVDVTWTVVQAPAGSDPVLVDADTLTPAFTADTAGEYVLSLVAYDGHELSAADTITITVVPVVGTAEELLLEALDVLRDLPRSAFDAPGHRLVMCVAIRAILVDLRDGCPTWLAVRALERLVERTDGFALRGKVDARGASKDWIVTEAGQDALYPLLTAALDLLGG